MTRKRKRRPQTELGRLIRKTSSDIFDSAPLQIFALRKSIGWTRQELGRFMGVYVNPTSGDCNSVRRWETGESRPHPIHRARLVQLSELFSDQYLAKLCAIELAGKG